MNSSGVGARHGSVRTGILVLLGVGILGFCGWQWLHRKLLIASATIAAQQFFQAYQNKDWHTLYRYLPVQGKKFKKDGQWVIVYPWVTEGRSARGREQVGPLWGGPNFTMRYRVEGARLVDGETADIKVAYHLGSAEQVRVFDLDFSRPNGIGRSRGTQSAR